MGFDLNHELTKNSLLTTAVVNSEGSQTSLVRLDPRKALNDESSTIANSFEKGAFCSENGQTKIRIFMVHPKTSNEFAIQTYDGCKYKTTVIWDPWDSVPNQNLDLAHMEDYDYWNLLASNEEPFKYERENPRHVLRTRNTNGYHDFRRHNVPIDTPGRSGHSFDEVWDNEVTTYGYGRGVFQTRFYEATPYLYDLKADVKHSLESGEYDYLFICHSQGCNILKEILKKVCRDD